MKATATVTISLPPDMATQMALVQKEDRRSRPELMREAWRHYFESRYPITKPSKSELSAIRKGRAEFNRGEFVSLAVLKNELASARHKERKKVAVKPASKGPATR